MARTAEERRAANLEAVRRWQKKNPEKVAQTRRALQERHPERYREYVRKYRAGVRDFVREEKIRLGCVDCGYNDHPDALQWDHVRGEKKGSPSTMSLTAAKAEMAKCEVRCANCHAIRSAQQQKERRACAS